MTATILKYTLANMDVNIDEDEALAIIKYVSWRSTADNASVDDIENWLCSTRGSYRKLQVHIQVLTDLLNLSFSTIMYISFF